VLDELVKNFIKVRAKLLELVTNEGKTPSVNTTAMEGDKIKNKSSLINNKRRKAQTKSGNSTRSLSPDTKRQKIDTTGKEQTSNPVETTTVTNSETEDSYSGSVPEVFVIEKDNNQEEQETSEPQPMVTEEDTSEKQPSQQVADAYFAECPVCGDMIPHRKINSHLDVCLTRTEKKSSLRRKKASETKSICSTSTKRKFPPGTEWKESEAVSSDDSLSCVTQDPCSSKAVCSSSSLMTKGSNALIQTFQKRKPLTKLVYSVMPEKELRRRLKEWNLSTKGDKPSLVRRHQDFVMLYNAQCDAAKPMTAAQVAKEVERAEKMREKEASSLVEASTSGLRFDKNQSEEDMDKTRQKYLSEHQNDFDKLIADIRKRQKGKIKKTAAETSATESLDTKINNPGEDLIKSENKESGNTEGIDDQEIKDSTDDSDTCLGTHPPFMKTNSKDSSALNECETSSSVIPEPPSSPSLASLPDEEEEFTPSLGLEGDDWECKDEETSDPNVIPESPVIKVGKSADGNTDKEAEASESDEDYPQRRPSFSNRRVKSNLF